MDEIDKPLSRSVSMLDKRNVEEFMMNHTIRVPLIERADENFRFPYFGSTLSTFHLTKTQIRGTMPYAGAWADMDPRISYIWYSWRSDDEKHWINGPVLGFAGHIVKHHSY